MKCYIRNIISEKELHSEVKTLIPDAALRRRMSRIVKMSVSTAIECIGGVEKVKDLDAVITATGWGCLQDSEKFLRNFITDQEQLLNPTPFIQSTFNTVGGQIAILRSNHCYNVTYVDRTHAFEDALLDAFLRMADGESHSVLVGSYDERTDAEHQILSRMGVYRHAKDGEGCVFAWLSPSEEGAAAELSGISFPEGPLTEEECRAHYATCPDARVLYNAFDEGEVYPTCPSRNLVRAVRMIQKKETSEVILYHQFWKGKTSIMTVRSI